MSTLFDENAQRLRELHARIHETFRRHPHGPEHETACAEFHREYDSLAFPGGLNRGLGQLAAGELSAIEITIRFLEADPWFHRSGYIKETMLRRLKHCALTSDQRERIAHLIIRSIDNGGRREFQGFSRLAGLVYSPEMVRTIESRATSKDPEVVRRAGAVLHVLISQGIIERPHDSRRIR